MNNESKRTAVYITLICIGVVITTLFVIMLSYNLRVFMLLLILYFMSFSIYIFVYLMINKEKLDDEVKYEVAKYSSLFNIFFGAAIFILGIIFTSKIPGYGAPPSRY
jgi:hypothetical protein